MAFSFFTELAGNLNDCKRELAYLATEFARYLANNSCRFKTFFPAVKPIALTFRYPLLVVMNCLIFSFMSAVNLVDVALNPAMVKLTGGFVGFTAGGCGAV